MQIMIKMVLGIDVESDLDAVKTIIEDGILSAIPGMFGDIESEGDIVFVNTAEIVSISTAKPEKTK